MGSLWFLVLCPLYDWGELGPKTAQKWFHDPEKPKKAQTVREEPKKAQNWSGRSPKSSEMVHKKLGDGAVNPKKLRNCPGEDQNGSEVVREKPKRLRNGPGEAQKGSDMVREKLKSFQAWAALTARNGPEPSPG